VYCGIGRSLGTDFAMAALDPGFLAGRG